MTIREYNERLNTKYSSWDEISKNIDANNLELLKECSGKLNWSSFCYYNRELTDEFLNSDLANKFALPYICVYCKTLSEEYCERIKDKVSTTRFAHILHNNKFSEDFLSKNFNYLPLETVLSTQQVSESFIEEFYLTRLTKHKRPTDLIWGIVHYQKLSMPFILKYEKIWLSKCPEELFKSQKLSEEFILENFSYTNWRDVLLNQTLSIEFLTKYFYDFYSQGSWNVMYLLDGQSLTEDFIEHFWKIFRKYKTWYEKIPNLSLDFINRHYDEIDWAMFSKTQKMSVEFIEAHKDKLQMKQLLFNPNISAISVLRHCKNHITVKNIKIMPKNNKNINFGLLNEIGIINTRKNRLKTKK